MGWYENDDIWSNNGGGFNGGDLFRWIVYTFLVALFVIVEIAAISTWGISGLFVGFGVLIVIVCFFGCIFSDW